MVRTQSTLALADQLCRPQRVGLFSRRALTCAAGAIAVLLGLTAYDAFGARAMRQFAAENADDPAAVRSNWESYCRWHPTRHLFQSGYDRAEAAALRDLDERIAGQRYAEQLKQLTRRAADPETDADAVCQLCRQLCDEFPDRQPDAALEQLRDTARRRRDAERERAARSALADLERAERQADLSALIVRADQFLRDHGDTPVAGEVKKRRAAYLRWLDEHDIETARDYAAREPLNFPGRRQHYQEYLDHHPTGIFATEAATAIQGIADEWDRHDYRAVRDHYRDHTADVKELEARGRSYLAAHGQGRFRAPVAEVLRWAERVVEPADYRVVLRSGQFERRIAWLLSRGPDLSVEIEVNGARYGPSNIVKNRYDPVWDYEFPRRVRWKLGDPVRIRVFDHDYYKRLVLDIPSKEDDPVAFWMLSGGVRAGDNLLFFESDFHLPELPPAE